MDIVIPLGGKGERFARDREFAYTVKPLLKVFGKPMISYVLDSVVSHMNTDDTISILYDKSLDEYDFAATVAHAYPSVSLVPLPRTSKGAADTVQMTLQDSHRPLLLMDCDTFYTDCILDRIRDLQSIGASGVFCFSEEPITGEPRFSYIIKDDNNRITDIKEKQRIGKLACSGAYYFNDRSEYLSHARKIIEQCDGFNGEYYTSCVIKAMLRSGVDFRAIHLEPETFFILGTPKQMRDFVNRTMGFLFDLDGTLVSSDHVYHAVWREILRPFHVDMTAAMFRDHVRGKSDKHVLETLIPNAPEGLLDVISAKKDALFCKYADRSTLIPGALEYVQKAKQMAHRVFIVTNCNRKAATKIVTMFGFSHMLDGLIIGGECEEAKPSHHPYSKAIQLSGVPSERCIAFEDSATGIRSARAAGVAKVVVIGGDKHPDFHGVGHELASDQDDSGADELRKCLTKCLPDAVSVVRVSEKTMSGGYIASVRKLELLVHKTIVPAVAKMKAKCSDGMLLTMADKLKLHDREHYFYEKIYPYAALSLKTPRYLGTIFDPNSFDTNGILLEDMSGSHTQLSVDLNEKHLDTTLRVVERMANLHAMFANKGDLKRLFPLLVGNDDPVLRPFMADFVKEHWPAFKAKWRDVLSEEQLLCGETMVHLFSDIQLHLSEGHCKTTLCHGDIKAGNLFLVGEEPCFVDWQYVCIGSGAQDLAFFMIESFDPDRIQKWERVIIDYYVLKVNEFGLKISEQEFGRDFACACCYFPLFVAIWFGVAHERDLVDVNFPFLFIQKYFAFVHRHVNRQYLLNLFAE